VIVVLPSWVTSVAFDPRSASTIDATYGNFGSMRCSKVNRQLSEPSLIVLGKKKQDPRAGLTTRCAKRRGNTEE
jgi:hypothetical protein